MGSSTEGKRIWGLRGGKDGYAKMKRKGGARKYLQQNFDLYLLLLPALIYVFIFHLLPMVGILIAFKDYNMFQVPGDPFRSILESPWAGFKYFEQVFKKSEFQQAFANTLIISLYKIIFTFPLPIIFAVFLNEVRSTKFQKGLQLIVYLPHFLSWVVIYGIFVSFLGSTGVINSVITSLGFEPVSFLILPFLPGALGMALARLFGLGALGCLYGGRLVNLLAYTALCYAALRSAHKCRPAFLCIMLMPMSLYMGASLSYDATLLGCYYLMLALLTRDEWNDKTALFYALACVFANGTKPYINLLWVVLPLILRKSEWKVRFSRAVYAVLTAAGALALTLGVEQYGTLLRHNYGAIARQGGTTVNGGAQLLFVLKNPLRYIAVLLGTLYENDGFLGQLGLFGWKDMPIAFISITAPPVLLAAAMLCTAQTDTLGRRRMGWLGVFGLVYAVGAMTAMYITYTPVGMVRIVGLQTRYFLPVWLLLVLAAAAVLRRVLAPRLTAAQGRGAGGNAVRLVCVCRGRAFVPALLCGTGVYDL